MVIVSVVTITAFAAAATYKVTVNEAGKKAYTVSTRADSVEKFVEDNADACHSASTIISTPLLSKSARTAQ